MIPLRNNLFVKLDQSLPAQSGIFLATDTTHWREAKDQIGNRGTVVQVGIGKRHKKTGTLMLPQCKEGDTVRFSELQYPSFVNAGERYIIINDQDIVGIES